MSSFKYLILLSLTLLSIESYCSSLAFAKTTLPTSCSKIKHDMVRACSKRDRSCSRRTNALNRCIKRAAYLPSSKPTLPAASVCAMEFKPVCAVTGKGDLEIFSNSCFAYQAGAVEVQFEQCKGPVEK